MITKKLPVKNILLPLTLILTSAAAGFLGGRLSAPNAPLPPLLRDDGSGNKPGKSKSMIAAAAPAQPSEGPPRTSSETDTTALPSKSTNTALSLDQILQILSRAERERSLFDLASADFAHDPSGWQNVSNSITDLVDRQAYLRGIAASWGKKDPRAALAYFSALPLKLHCELVPEILEHWTLSDPAAAIAWTTALPSGELKDRACDSAYSAWAIVAPEQAAAHSLAIADDNMRQRAMSAVAREWSTIDFQAAMEWSSKLSNEGQKSTVVQAITEEMSRRAPSLVFQWAAGLRQSTNQQEQNIVSTVASNAGFVDPVGTFDWLVSTPLSDGNQPALAGATAYLVEQDPKIALEKFPSLSPSIKDTVGPAIATVLGIRSPDMGSKWLSTISNPALRETATSAFASGWAGRDPQAATNWANSLPSDRDRQAALQGVANPTQGAQN